MNLRAFTFLIAIALLVIAILSACDNGPETNPQPDTTLSTVSDSSPPGGGGSSTQPPVSGSPSTFSDTVTIGGQLQAVQLQHIGDQLPFDTYYPPDAFEPKTSTDERGTGVIFMSKISGEPRDDAYLLVFIPATPKTVTELTGFMQEGMQAQNVTVTPSDALPGCPWAMRTFQLEKAIEDIHFGGFVCIGEHDGSAFYTVAYYPTEYVNVVRPEIDLILRHFKWDDQA
jgi:hypothetical protein